MNGWWVDSWALVAGAALLGMAAGHGWARLRSTRARRRRSSRLAAVQALFDQEKLRCGQLEAELHAQRARCFALEHELESRDSDWAQSSPTPISFDGETFQVDRTSLVTDDTAAAEQPDRIAALEGQVRDLQDLLSKVASRARATKARGSEAVDLVEDVTPSAVRPGP